MTIDKDEYSKKVRGIQNELGEMDLDQIPMDRKIKRLGYISTALLTVVGVGYGWFLAQSYVTDRKLDTPNSPASSALVAKANQFTP